MSVRFSSQSMLLPFLMLHFAVAATSAPDIVAQFEGDVTLSCLFPSQPGMNLQRLTLTWQKERAGAEALVLHSYYYGKEQLETQDQIYRNRTQLDPEGLVRGNASLTLRGIRIQDEGVYLCHITLEQGKFSVRRQIAVMAPYSEVRLEVSMSSQVTLTCRAEGGYPEASVLWLDGAGSNMTVESDTSLQRDPSGLCDVSSRILLPRTGCGNYTCLLESPRQPCVVRHLSVSCSPDNCTNNLCLPIALPLMVLLGVLGSVLCFLRRRFSWCSAASRL